MNEFVNAMSFNELAVLDEILMDLKFNDDLAMLRNVQTDEDPFDIFDAMQEAVRKAYLDAKESNAKASFNAEPEAMEEVEKVEEDDEEPTIEDAEKVWKNSLCPWENDQATPDDCKCDSPY